MSFYRDVLSLVSYALLIFTTFRSELTIALLIAIALAAGCWAVAMNYSRLWNLRFRTTAGHQLLCLFAALCTLVFALLFVSLKYTKQAADLAIDIWKAQLIADPAWGRETYRTAYYAVTGLGLEDFSATLPPEQGGRIPLRHSPSIKKFAEVFAKAAVENFRVSHPFLNKILRTRADFPAELIDQRVTEFFRLNPGASYPATEAINIAAAEIKSSLQTQTERIVPVARTLLVALFLVVQLIPFGMIGYAAYRDLKVTT